jgi:1-acyl-sn-glycerol-3-phosphate acyltransferase
MSNVAAKNPFVHLDFGLLASFGFRPSSFPYWALAALAALCLILLWRGVVLYRRTRYTIPQVPLYLLNYFLNRVVWRTTVSGPLPIPMDKGAIIVSNHRVGVDPLFIAMTTPRPVHWMVAREYCELWTVGWGFRILQAIPTNRAGIDTAATRMAIRLAQQGELVGILPEGRINKSEELLLPGRPGAALIALKARVPIVPCYISGARMRESPFSSFFMRARVHVEVGPPMDLSPWYDRADDRQAHQEITLLLLKEIARLAGRDDFEPQLAGRRWKPGTEVEEV